MSNIKSSLRIVSLCHKEQTNSFEARQIPINIDENLMIKVEFPESKISSSCQSFNRKTTNYETFLKDYGKLTFDELKDGLCIPMNQIRDYVFHSVPCIGCRSSIENFLKLFLEQRHAGLEPFYINEKGSLTIRESFSSNPDAIFSLFHVEGAKVKSFIESIPKSKKNRRCHIHSLDKTKSIHDWEQVWDAMNRECHDEITLVDGDFLFDTVENYLRKHKFCSECKTKVYEAYDILMDFPDCKEHDRKSFCPTLYEGFRCCSNEKHVHIEARKELINSLILRGESEIEENRRERHAKTIDAAQEEILTCVGIFLFDRFEKLFRTIRSEEQIFKLIFYISVDCLKLNFQKMFDRKKDFSATLDLLCEEFRVADLLKEQKKQQKRSKRKARRQSKTNDVRTNFSNEKFIEEEKQTNKFVDRHLSNSFCSCLCHFRDQRSNSLSILQTTIRTNSLVKSSSCPTFSFVFNRFKNEQTPKLSSSLETLLSSISTRECRCDETNSEKIIVSGDELTSSSSNSCLRCFSTRTDPGYSSGQDETSSSGHCECLIGSSTRCCPLHEEEEEISDEGGASISPCNSMLSSTLCNRRCCVHDTFLNHSKTIELFDQTREHKLKLQLSSNYPYFTMDLKKIWDEENAFNHENRSFISDEDLQQFSKLNENFDLKRAQIREQIKLQFKAWKEQFLSLSLRN